MNHVVKSQYQEGFTLIELMLSMSFISILLLAIAMTILQIGTTYNKGLALKEVNQASRNIAADVRKSLSSAPDIKYATDYVTIRNDANTAFVGGRLCLGSYSYVWNTLNAFGKPDTKSDDDSHLAVFEKTPYREVQFVKVPDPSKIYCAKKPTGELVYLNIRTADNDVAQELLSEGDHALSLTQLTFTQSTSARDDATREALYTLNYTLGTGLITAMNADQSACLDASHLNSDLSYCNVVQFSIVVRAGSGV